MDMMKVSMSLEISGKRQLAASNILQRDSRYILEMNFMVKYNEVGASELKEDFYHRHDVYPA